jgi:Ca-activated chloride channel family protein
MPRDVTFVIDVSGSMSGDKLVQAKAAGRTLLGTLSARDRFRLVSFATDVEDFREDWSNATPENLRAAERWLKNLRASGSTNIEGALERALEMHEMRGRMGVVLFLTDGAATVGERNADRLAERAAKLRGAQRVFTFGVGADVQAGMLERIALEGRGTAHFVQPSEDVEHAVGVVAARLTAPVATNVRLHAAGITLRQMQPGDAQDVFVGQDLTFFVRYRGAGPATLTFEGDSPNGPVRWTQRVSFPDRSRENAFVAKLWAVQRVGWLSAERRRAGASAEIDTELRELGTKYGIPTELSSYLVLEPGMAAQALIRNRVTNGAGGAPQSEFAAARAAADQRATKSLADAAHPVMTAPSSARKDGAGQLRQVGDRTFVYNEARWVDTRFNEKLRRVTVKPFTQAYFSLVERIPELKAMFALGERVTVGGRSVGLLLDVQGVDQLSASDLAAVVRDW